MKNLKQPLRATMKVLCAASFAVLMGTSGISNANNGPVLSESIIVKPVSRSFEQMVAADVLNPVSLNVQEAAPFRPTMGEAEYQQAKKTANQTAGLTSLRSGTASSFANLPATVKDVNCTGLTQSGWVPPDTHGAMGHSHYVQVVNSHIRMYDRAGITGDMNIACGPAVKSVSLNAFVGYFTQALFDPRVVYDPQWRRWIVTAPAFPESGTLMRHFVAISQTSNPTGGWWIYNLNMGASGEFYDYPQLGFDADGLILTANLFKPGYIGSRVTFLSKSRAYNGLGIPYCNWGGGPLNFTTIAPPIVRDLGNETWLASAGGNRSVVRVSRWNNSGHLCGNYLGYKDIPVPAYSIPPAAPQPGTTATLDTLDARFVNNSTQIGSYLYNVHAVAVGPAAVRRYQLNVPAGTASTITFFSSGISSDFNASIAVTDGLSEYITFSRSDAATFPEVRFAGKQNADVGFGLGTAFTSAQSLTGQSGRWGDYSAVTIDPANTNWAWAVNEMANTGTTWGSRIFKMGIP